MRIMFSDKMIQKLIKSKVADKYYNTLELELKFLRTFLNYTAKAAKRCFECQNLKDIVTCAEAVDQRAERELKSLDYLNEEMMVTRFINLANHVVDEVKLMRSDIRQVHWIVWRTSRSDNYVKKKLVITFIDSLLENLADLVSLKVDLADPLKIKLEAIAAKLASFRTFLNSEGKKRARHKKLNNLLNHAKAVADNAAYLCYSCLDHEMDKDMLERLVSDLSGLELELDPQFYNGVLEASSESSGSNLCASSRDKIAVDFVESLENVKKLLFDGLKLPMRDQIEILQEELALLRGFLMDPPEEYTGTQTLNDLLTHSKVISTKANSVICSLHDIKMNEERATEVYSSLVDLLEETKLIKAKITEIYLKIPKPRCPKFPSTDELGFLDCFLGNLRELLNNRTDSITFLNLPVESLVEQLQFLKAFLSRIAKQHTEQDNLKVLWTKVIDVAYKAEYIMDSLLVGNGPLWHLMLWLSEVRKEIEVLKEEVNKINEKKMHESEVDHGEKISDQASSQATSPEMDDVSVGFEDEEESILEYLVSRSAKLQMVSIVGMPGLGKTHLAKKIYNNSNLKDHFYVRAWCYISQIYSKKYLLTCILRQVVEPTKRISEMRDENELAEMLYKSLKGNRYLILIDDLWDVEGWNDLRRCFPDDNNGSRIMFTSRFHIQDLKASCSKIHHLRPFSNDESWLLLQEKVFQNESCPSELLEVGKQIAKNCNGMPLAVVVVAGILARIDKKQHQWREVANSLCSYIVNDPEKKVIKVVELSYKHLPDYLKPCFLYIGVFFENRYIPARKLIHLWLAEGFVQKVEEKSLEYIAENYLIDLMCRSLVIIAKRRSTGDIKVCHIHDLVRDFCLKKAKEDNFMQLIEQVPPLDSSTYDICEQRRISCNDPQRFIVSKAYGPHVRSLLFFGPNNFLMTVGHDVSSICIKFKLLRVLDLECIRILGTFPDGVDSLTHLRYLAICGDFGSIPSSIAKLWSLTTFLVKGSTSLVHLPDTIWNMVNLRHLHINDSALFCQPSNDRLSRLDNLQTISTLLLSYGDDTVELIKGFANVKNLSCIFFGSWDYSENCNRLPVLATLSQLESLKVRCRGEMLGPYEFSLPSSIKKLTVSEFRLPWNQISIFGKLPNLEVLKLHFEAFQGDEWDMGDGEFPKLKYLKLNNLDIRKWSVSSDYFPPLERLVMQSCPLLKEIPSCLGDIPTLNMVEVRWCNYHLKEFVKQIHEEQLEMGNQELKVLVK